MEGGEDSMQFPAVNCARSLRDHEPLERLIRKLGACRDGRHKTEDMRQDFPQAGHPIRPVDFLELLQDQPGRIYPRR